MLDQHIQRFIAPCSVGRCSGFQLFCACLRGAAKHGHCGGILAISLRTGGVANGPEMEDIWGHGDMGSVSLTSVVLYLDWFGGFISDGFLISSKQSCEQTFWKWKLRADFFFLKFPLFLTWGGWFPPKNPPVFVKRCDFAFWPELPLAVRQLMIPAFMQTGFKSHVIAIGSVERSPHFDNRNINISISWQQKSQNFRALEHEKKTQSPSLQRVVISNQVWQRKTDPLGDCLFDLDALIQVRGSPFGFLGNTLQEADVFQRICLIPWLYNL